MQASPSLSWPQWRAQPLAAPFAPLAALLAELPHERWPTADDWSRMAARRQLRNARGLPLRFVPAAGAKCAALDFERRIYAAGEVETRAENWHDAFHACAWALFPRAKARINALHVAAGAAPAPNGRSPLRDLLTLFDESGIVIACADARLAGLLADFQWHALFWTQRERVLRSMDFSLFGHALYEHCHALFDGVTGKGIVVPVTPAYFSLDAPRRLAHLDAALERMFAQAGPPEAQPAPAASAGRELDPDLNGCQQQGRDPNQEPRSNRKLSPAPARIAGLFPGHAASQVALPVLEQVPEQAPLQAPVQATEQATEQTTLQARAQVAGQLPAPLAEQTVGSFPEQAHEPNPPTSFEPPPPLRGPRDLQPLPLKGIPGWAAENQDPAYYRDERQFRRGRLRDRGAGAGAIDGSADATRGANPGGTPAHTARKPSTPNTTSKPSKPNTKSTPSTPNTTSTTSTPSTPSTPGTPGTPSSRRATRANNTKPRPGP